MQQYGTIPHVENFPYPFLHTVSFMARLKDPDPFARSGRSPDWPGDV